MWRSSALQSSQQHALIRDARCRRGLRPARSSDIDNTTRRHAIDRTVAAWLPMESENLVKHSGGCHCGRVRFECYTPSSEIDVEDCNCTICTKKGFLHLIVPQSRFRLLADESDLSLYTFGTGTAKHYFCSRCGIAPFYVPRSNPDGWDVNARCIEGNSISKMIIHPFDGRNSWEASATRIAHLSKE